MKIALKQFGKTRLPFLIPAAKRLIALSRYRNTKRKVRQLLQERKEIFVEVGSGDKPGKNGWVTIDRTDNCDLFWDLVKGIPFPNASVKKIYSSHFFEHLTFDQAQSFLKECRRVLAPGGSFLICVPNARIYLEAYVKGEALDPKVFFRWTPAFNNTTSIDAANYVAYMGDEHKYMFDKENLLFILGLAGLKNSRLREFDPSLDLLERDFESIYAEAEN